MYTLIKADNTWFFEYFYGFLGFVVWEISGHFGRVYQSRHCASDCAFLFSFVYVMYLNIASYLYGKQIKSKLGNTMCLWMIFICVHTVNECRTGILKTDCWSLSTYQLSDHSHGWLIIHCFILARARITATPFTFLNRWLWEVVA